MNTEALLQRLKAWGYTQTAIARITGVPQPRLSRWGAGKVPSAAEDALKLRALVERGKPRKR